MKYVLEKKSDTASNRESLGIIIIIFEQII